MGNTFYDVLVLDLGGDQAVGLAFDTGGGVEGGRWGGLVVADCAGVEVVARADC